MSSAAVTNTQILEAPPLSQRLVVSILRKLVPPHLDNEKAAELLSCQTNKNSCIEWVIVRPDALVDETCVSPFDIYDSPMRNSIFNSGITSRVNVATFMSELVSDENLWRKWKGKMPVLYNKNWEDIKMIQNTVKQQIEMADKAIMAKDYDTLMSIYTKDAVLVIEPGRNAIGKSQIRNAFMKISEFFDNGLRVAQNGLEVLDAGDTALVLANTVVSGPNFQAVERKATYVFKKSNDGVWLCAIDNSYGHEIIQKPRIKSLL